MMRQYLGFVALWGVIFVWGCAPAVMIPEPAQSPAEEEVSTKDAPPAQPAQLVAADYWEAVYLQGSKVGWIHTVREPVEENGQALWKTTIVTHLSTLRQRQESQQETRVVSVETSTGALVRYETESALGTTPVHSVGEVVGDKLTMRTTVGGNEKAAAIHWDAATEGGFDAGSKILICEPLRPGDRRTLRTLTQGLDQPMLATFKMRAKDWEEVTIDDRPQKLLRVDVDQTLAGAGSIASVMWLNERGEALKMEITPGMIALRTTRDVATAAANATQTPQVDVVSDLTVRVKTPPGDVHRAKQVRYRITLADGDPAKTFSQGLSQTITATDDPHTIQLNVKAFRLGQSLPADAGDPPTSGDKQASVLVQSDDPQIVALAQQAIGTATTDGDKAAAIERFVHGYIRQANFSQALATAVEVARTRQGDCTEYAVLVAALARAAGIPSRVAIGLVYTRSVGEPGYAFHMWDELYVDGVWIPYDATLGLGGIGGGHLKLSHTDLGDGNALAKFIPVIQVMGRLTIDVEQVEAP